MENSTAASYGNTMSVRGGKVFDPFTLHGRALARSPLLPSIEGPDVYTKSVSSRASGGSRGAARRPQRSGSF